MNEVLDVPAGTTASFDVTLNAEDAAGATVLVTSYTSPAWSPSASAWSGDDRAPWSPGPSAAWATDGSDGRVVLTFGAAVTATVEPATYPVEVLLVPAGGGDPVRGWLGSVRVLAGPGSAAALPTYGTHRDLLDYAAWLDGLRDAGDGAWTRERWRARQWANRILAARYRAWFDRRRDHEGWFAGVPLPATFEGYLEAAGGLRPTDRVVEATSRHAIALVCEQQVGATGKGPYVDLGRAMRDRANLRMAGLVAEISTKADGVYNLRLTPDALVTEPWPLWYDTPR